MFNKYVELQFLYRCYGYSLGGPEFINPRYKIKSTNELQEFVKKLQNREIH